MKKLDIDINVEDLIADRDAFNSFIYTPLQEALMEKEKRWHDKELKDQVDKFIGEIPKPFKLGNKAVLDRQLCTPNHELIYFMNLIKSSDLEPLFLEYCDDKFTSINPSKYLLGKMKFQQSLTKNYPVVSEKIIDFTKNDGKKICEVQTLWGQDLVNFHHELLLQSFPKSSKYIFDASSWLQKFGGKAEQYYSKNTALFVRNAILFENLITEGIELEFIKKIWIPSFIQVWEITGKKPLVVKLLPDVSEKDTFWMFHPLETHVYVASKKVSI